MLADQRLLKLGASCASGAVHTRGTRNQTLRSDSSRTPDDPHSV